MNKFKNALLVAVAMVLVAVISITATVAYLKEQTEVVKNTFSVGNVSITLDEAAVDENGVPIVGAARVMANNYRLAPGRTYKKDPTVHVSDGSESAYLFVKVVVADGFDAMLKETETIGAMMQEKGWKPLTGITGVDTTGVYYYNRAVNAGEDIKVFERFSIKDNVEYSALTPFNGKTIQIQAYAIQFGGFETAAAAYTAEPCEWTIPIS